MIKEIARFKIQPGQEDAFAAAALSCQPLFQAAAGFRSFHLGRAIENPDVFYLIIEWATLEDHTVHFRSSPAFQEWRSRVGGFFAEPPEVIHTSSAE